jgi:hypothetical protein
MNPSARRCVQDTHDQNRALGFDAIGDCGARELDAMGLL